MNKHELKSLLENIYYTLTEADSPQYIPPYRFPLVPIQIPTTPDATPPVTTPVPPKPISPDLYQSPTLTLTPNPNRPPRPDNDPEDPEEEAENERIWRGILRDLGITPETVPGLFESNLRDNINKHELKSLLENIYHLLAETPGVNDYQPDPNFVGPPAPAPYIPDISDPRNPGHQRPPTAPPMPLDKNGNPMFPSQKFWEELWQAQRRVPPGGDMITHPEEMAEILRLGRILRKWEAQQRQLQQQQEMQPRLV